MTIISSSDFLVSKRTPAKFQKSLAKAISNKGITVLTSKVACCRLLPGAASSKFAGG